MEQISLLTLCFSAGHRASEIKLITFNNALDLLLALPGRAAKKIRGISASIIVRYLAGDKSLVRELNQNANSTASINQMAQEALGITVEDKKKVQASEDFASFAIAKFNEASKSTLDVIKAVVEAKDGHIGDLKESESKIVKSKDETLQAKESVIEAKNSTIEAKDETIRVQAGVISVQQDAMALMKSLLGK